MSASMRALLSAGACLATCSVASAQNVESTVTVTGQRLEETLPEELQSYGSRLELIDAQAIERGGFNDVSQALQSLVPGLYVAPRSGAFDYVNVALQGSRNSEILWLVDGVRISNRLYNDTTPLDTLPAHMIERIEVLKGGQGLFYGTQAIAGVINVITKGFTKERDGELEAGTDTNDGRHLNGYLRGGFGNHGLVGYASYDDADGFQPFRDQDYQPSATRRKRGYDVETAGLKYAFEPSDALRFSASYQHTDASVEGPIAEDISFAGNDRDEDIVSAKLDWKLNDRVTFYVKGYYHDWDSYWTEIHNVLGSDGRPTGAVDRVTDRALWRFEDRGLNLLGEFGLTERLTGLLGYDFQEYEGRDDEFLIGQQSERVQAPFAQLRYDANVLAGASFAAGVRHNSPDDGEEKTVWNASGRLNVNQQTFVRAQVGTSFRLPSAYELYVIDPCCERGNPNLVGEESFNTELGVGYANERFSAELIGFRRTVDDLIDIDYDQPGFPDGLLVNTAEEVEVKGGELVLNARVSEQVRLIFDYTYTSAELEGSGEQIQDVPRDLIKLIVEWTAPSRRFGVSATANRVGEIFDSVSGVGRVEHGDYSIVDLSGFAFIDAAHRHRLGVRVENLFDEEYATQVRRTRRDSDNSSYGAWSLGTPLTGHLTYSYHF